jgi:cyclomaltodextrinase
MYVNFMTQEDNVGDLPKGIYQHYKGNHYQVIEVALHSETLEKMVVYRALKDGGVWVRPLSMFLESIKFDDTTMPRFKFIEAISTDEIHLIGK